MVWPLARWVAGKTLLPFSGRTRYELAVRLSRAALPLLRESPAMHAARARSVEADPDIALGLALYALDRGGTPYEPRFVLEGEEILREALARGRGVLCISVHAALAYQVPRALDMHGYAMTAISSDPFHLRGTRRFARTIIESPRMPLEVRTALRRGELLGAMLDRLESEGRRITTVRTPLGEVPLADALLRVALRCGAPVVFLWARGDADGAIRVRVGAPPPEAAGSVEAIRDAFADALSAHVSEGIRSAA